MLVPQDLPVVPLEAQTARTAQGVLEVLTERVLVPRDLPATPLERPKAPPARFPPTILDARVAVPPDARPPALELKGLASAASVSTLVDPDVFTTGEVHLLARPMELGAGRLGWKSGFGSILVHAILISLALLLPELFPYRPPTQDEIELAHRSLGLVYVPPPLVVPKPVPVPQPAPQIRIDPRVFRYVAPPEVEASPNPGSAQREPEVTQRDQPVAPTPQLPGAGGDGSRQAARLEPPKTPEAPSGVVLPPSTLSPGRLLEDSLRGAARNRGGDSGEFGGPLPPIPGGGQGYVGGTVQILTPTEGVDFTYYIARMLASVRRNWYAVIPESARLGERGVVVLDFAVLRDGSVPPLHPELVRTSGREPLDRAAISAIRASSPFEPLPAAFGSPLVKFRFIFLYNVRTDQS